MKAVFITIHLMQFKSHVVFVCSLFANKQFYLLCGVRMTQRYQKYAIHALLCIMLGQRQQFVYR